MIDLFLGIDAVDHLPDQPVRLVPLPVNPYLNLPTLLPSAGQLAGAVCEIRFAAPSTATHRGSDRMTISSLSRATAGSGRYVRINCLHEGMGAQARARRDRYRGPKGPTDGVVLLARRHSHPGAQTKHHEGTARPDPNGSCRMPDEPDIARSGHRGGGRDCPRAGAPGRHPGLGNLSGKDTLDRSLMASTELLGQGDA